MGQKRHFKRFLAPFLALLMKWRSPLVVLVHQKSPRKTGYSIPLEFKLIIWKDYQYRSFLVIRIVGWIV